MATAMNEKREKSVHTSVKDLCGKRTPYPIWAYVRTALYL